MNQILPLKLSNPAIFGQQRNLKLHRASATQIFKILRNLNLFFTFDRLVYARNRCLGRLASQSKTNIILTHRNEDKQKRYEAIELDGHAGPGFYRQRGEFRPMLTRKASGICKEKLSLMAQAPLRQSRSRPTQVFGMSVPT